MRPDIIKWYSPYWIDGFVGVFCECGRTLYIKNDQSNEGQSVEIECPCGKAIYTRYTKYSHN